MHLAKQNKVTEISTTIIITVVFKQWQSVATITATHKITIYNCKRIYFKILRRQMREFIT